MTDDHAGGRFVRSNVEAHGRVMYNVNSDRALARAGSKQRTTRPTAQSPQISRCTSREIQADEG
jgi:hypothetical protein